MIPEPGLAQRVAGFSGAWEGSWGGILPSRLIVERVTSSAAFIVYTWADHPQGRLRGGWSRTRADVSPDETLIWGQPSIRFAFTISDDLQSVSGIRDEAGAISRVVMLRCLMGP